jgi:hypothetical protein
MAGTTIPLISKRTYSFTSDAIVVVAKAVNVVNWTSGLLVVRVHSLSDPLIFAVDDAVQPIEIA